MNRKKIKEWAVAALIRAAKTMAQTAAATLSVAVVMSDVNWVMVASSTLLAGILSMLTSVGGLPEVKESEEYFIELAISEVYKYVLNHLDRSDGTPVFDIFVVWSCKTLQNHKCLISTTLHDGMYYECTYNGDKNEMYLDAYKKFENKKIICESEE